MSGYSKQPYSSNQVLIFEPDTVDELYDRVFYGMTYDPSTGKISVEIIKDGETIEIPNSTNFSEGSYAHWFSSSKQINFNWKESEKSHLLIEVI
jgi:hypothetical protein